MPKVNDRTGQRIGALVVIDYPPIKNAPITCRCDCGDVRVYTRDILKPSYRHAPLMCPLCAGHDCEICGKRIGHKSRQKAMTCSDACAKERHRRNGREYYKIYRHTEAYRRVYAARQARHKARLADDPQYASVFRVKAAERVRRSIANASPEKRAIIAARCRRFMQIRDAFRDADSVTRNKNLDYQRRYYVKRRDWSAVFCVWIYVKKTQACDLSK